MKKTSLIGLIGLITILLACSPAIACDGWTPPPPPNMDAGGNIQQTYNGFVGVSFPDGGFQSTVNTDQSTKANAWSIGGGSVKVSGCQEGSTGFSFVTDSLTVQSISSGSISVQIKLP